MNHHRIFGRKSADYAEARPRYPKEIYEYLVSVCQKHERAWDTACGNGQAAVDLANYFERVEATDISEGQVAQALQHPKVNYSVQPSEETNFDDDQFDLVCVAQALHWFDYDAFWPEVKRVLKPEGVFAAWGYSWFSIDDRIDEIIQDTFLNTIEPYWAWQNKLLWEKYQTILFPFERLETPNIEMKMDWNLHQLFAYLRSWSATSLCIEEIGEQFIAEAFFAVQSAWGEPGVKKPIEIDFCMLVGR